MDGLHLYIKRTLPKAIENELYGPFNDLVKGNFISLFSLPLVKILLGHDDTDQTLGIRFDGYNQRWHEYLLQRLGALLDIKSPHTQVSAGDVMLRRHLFFLVAVASLQAFVQSNITGPPLPFHSSDLLFPEPLNQNRSTKTHLRQALVNSLGVDGEAAYKLTPNVELLCLADTILMCPLIRANVKSAEWAILRTNFMHQRILSEISPTLQEAIYDSLDALDQRLDLNSGDSELTDLHPLYLLEKTSIHLHFGFDSKARETIDDVVERREFQFALTGRLGKRTKYQERDTSQLVVLAKSNVLDDSQLLHKSTSHNSQVTQSHSKPKMLDLNDDTLLESISFSQATQPSFDVVYEADLSKDLTLIDPESQPPLHPLDSITLLLLASSITNTSPADGLTREETLPYATRVLEDASSNWQVYTQALLVRSRIEGYRARTAERGLLQLQALVDQVILETAQDQASETSESSGNASTFLPRAKPLESASASERLRYVYELCPPTRWELEAELAARWVNVGGLKTALEIYQRLEMWAEEALCWAATNREDKARRIIRKQLFNATSDHEGSANDDGQQWNGPARNPAPDDAPRLYCILGDIDNDVSMYEKAWIVSKGRYARAQRSIGKYYFSRNKLVESAAAYSKALQINQLNHSSWFALGCCLLELMKFDKAAEAFRRTVQIDDTDAEAWSNLAAALLKGGATLSDPDLTLHENEAPSQVNDENNHLFKSHAKANQQHIRDALNALKRAASLKFENHKIWDNLLTVAASLNPPEYKDMISAQRRVIELRGPVEGEKCIDASILETLVRHVITNSDVGENQTQGRNLANVNGDAQVKRGTPRLLLSLIEDCVIPLITASARLWRLVATLALWRQKPGEALAANEKAWRIVINPNSGWETGTEEQWNEVVQATEDLCDAYENLGSLPQEGDQENEVVAKDWRFKSRSAVRTVMGKGKATWEDTPGWTKLQEKLDELKAGQSAS